MKSDDTLHPCNEIPGGLWVGAVVSLAGRLDVRWVCVTCDGKSMQMED